MITNIVQFLHTTVAYQAAALQLMTGRADFAARHLDLKEPLPIIIEKNTNEWSVLPAPCGVGGIIMTSNYVYGFVQGRLNRVAKRQWERRMSPALTNVDAWTHQVSVIDTNGAYQLATNWLAKLSIDVTELEKRLPMRVVQRTLPVATTNKSHQVIHEQVAVPFFDVVWSKDQTFMSSAFSSIAIKIVGTTPELLALNIRDTSFYLQEPLRVTNAAELLGPLPQPRHFVEKLMGGVRAHEIVSSPDQVEAWLLNENTSQSETGVKSARAGPLKLKPAIAKRFSEALLDFNTYEWTASKMCSPNYGVRLRFERGNDLVEILLCYDCNILQVSYKGRTREESFDFGYNQLVKAVKKAFPKDELIRKLESNDPDSLRKEYLGALNQYENQN